MSETRQSLQDYEQRFVVYFHRGIDIYAARRSLLTLLSEPLPVRGTEVRRSVLVVREPTVVAPTVGGACLSESLLLNCGAHLVVANLEQLSL